MTARPARRRARLAIRLLGPALGVAGATGGTAAVLASRVVTTRRSRRYPHRLLTVDGDTVVLGRNEETERPGTYGLSTPEAHAVLGEVASLDDRVVVRSLVRVDHGTLRVGPAALDHVHVGDPRSAVGIEHEELQLSGETGPLPAWLVPGDDTWVIVAHGLGGTRASSLSFLPLLHEAGLTILVVSYRNDPGAGPSGDRRLHLGDEEWRDVDVAMAYALAKGARRLVLFGWSLGGAVVLQALDRSPRSGAVCGVVLDSPVLDWRRTLHHVGHRAKVPRSLVALATALVERRVGIDLDRFDWLRRHGELAVPVLVFHGETDATVPYGVSHELARARPDLVELVAPPGAGHVGSWNVDPAGYAERLTRFVAAATARAQETRPATWSGGRGDSSQRATNA